MESKLKWLEQFMIILVHWIVDGIADVEAKDQEEAERWVNEILQAILNGVML